MSEQTVNETQPITPEELVETLRTLRQRIPDYVQLQSTDSKAARTAANLHPQFKEAAISAVGASDIVSAAVGKSADDLHRMNDEAERWAAAIGELRAFTQGVVGTNLKRRQSVGVAALQSYNITRQLVRHQAHADLLPHLAEMKATNRLGHPRRKTPALPAPPTPQ